LLTSPPDIASVIAKLDIQPNLVIFTGTPTQTPSKRQGLEQELEAEFEAEIEEELEEELLLPEIEYEESTYPYDSDSEYPEYESPFTAGHRNSSSPSNKASTIPPRTAPLLQRVQLFTTPLIVSLLISFFIFIPIVSFGVKALVGIQVPPRMLEISKSMVVGKDKKDQ
jgi:hypothetical protein